MPQHTENRKKKIELKDIFSHPIFKEASFKPSRQEDISLLVNKDQLKDSRGRALSLTDFSISPDKKKILIFRNRTAIYRRSSKAYCYLYERDTESLTLLDKEKIMHACFSPRSSGIAYVKDNNLYLYTLATHTAMAITTDGKRNKIINGNCDWVYEEEFGFTRAFEWSPDGNYLAYYRFDESAVKTYGFTLYNKSYNKEYRYKYPKAGERNSVVDIHIYSLRDGKTQKVQYEEGDVYLPRIKWTASDNQLVVFWLNRHQNDLRLLLTEATTGKVFLLYRETDPRYVEITDNWWFLKDRQHFLFTSEKAGYNQLYIHSLDGKTSRTLTHGAYDITEVNGIDEKRGLVYYTAAYPRPMDRSFFVTDFGGSENKLLLGGEAWHQVKMNEDLMQLQDGCSSLNEPMVVTSYQIRHIAGQLPGMESEKTVEDNHLLKRKLAGYLMAPAGFIQIPNARGDLLNGWILKPPDFNASLTYPVLFCNYGGPGSQSVANRFGTVSYWHHLLAQKGFIIVCVDNTGTGFRGADFKKKTYQQLGKLEMEDQMAAAAFMARQPYVDASRIGHWGWSFGGFMSALAISRGAGIFSYAIAVAPVTSWRFYDTVYTERYMRTPRENPRGYDTNSPLQYVKNIRGKFLLIHGTADDNVHFQNSVVLSQAMIDAGIAYDTAYYPNKNHRIKGAHTTLHLWTRMTRWLEETAL